MKRVLVSLVALICIVTGAVCFSRIVSSSVGPTPIQKRGRSARRPAAPSAISSGVRITAVSIEAVGKSWSEGSEQSAVEAEDGQEILVVHLKLRSTPALHGKTEIELARPVLFLDEGRTGKTNLAGFQLFHYPNQPINQEMDIPFIVPEGAEPQALSVGEAALDLTKLTVIEPTVDPAQAARDEAFKQQREMYELNKRIKEINEQNRRFREQMTLRPVPTPQLHVTQEQIDEVMRNSRIQVPSPSPTPSP